MNMSNKSYKPPGSFPSSNSKAQETNTSKHTSQRSNSCKLLFCTYSEDTTHLVDMCFYLLSFPLWHKLHGKDVKPPNRSKKPSMANQTQSTKERFKFSIEKPAQLKSLLRDGKPRANFTGKIPIFCALASSSSTHPWILDSGAINHIAPCSRLSITTLLNSTVDLPNGSHAKISGLGFSSLGPNLFVDGVLCVPSFHVNLLYVSKLTSRLNCSIHLFPTFCVLQDLALKRMIGLGKQVNGLYYLLMKENATTPPSISNTTTCHLNHKTAALWHQCLGHPSQEPSKLLSQTISKIAFDLHHHYDVCPLAKQTHLPFSSSSIYGVPIALHLI
ncbi:hypothetical protein GBA52_007988 [Prunus armeniaca]|nr:hypothetical protein GBA52_007988 [Prunus armeniaca]